MTRDEKLREVLSSIIWSAIQDGYTTRELRDDSARKQARDMLHIDLLNQALLQINQLFRERKETCGISAIDGSKTYGCPHCGRPVGTDSTVDANKTIGKDELTLCAICKQPLVIGKASQQWICNKHLEVGKDKDLIKLCEATQDGTLKKELDKTVGKDKEVEELNYPDLATCDYGDTDKVIDYIIVLAKKINEVIDWVERKR